MIRWIIIEFLEHLMSHILWANKRSQAKDMVYGDKTDPIYIENSYLFHTVCLEHFNQIILTQHF